MITIGLGTLTAPELLTGLSFDEYKAAFSAAGNYRHLSGEELDNALTADWEQITGKKVKKSVKSTNLGEG